MTDDKLEVTEAWWGDDTHRAFIVAFEGANVPIGGFVDNVIARFRTYVPQHAP